MAGRLYWIARHQGRSFSQPPPRVQASPDSGPSSISSCLVLGGVFATRKAIAQPEGSRLFWALMACWLCAVGGARSVALPLLRNRIGRGRSRIARLPIRLSSCMWCHLWLRWPRNLASEPIPPASLPRQFELLSVALLLGLSLPLTSCFPISISGILTSTAFALTSSTLLKT